MNYYMVNTAGKRIPRSLGSRNDPYMACNFMVEVGGIAVAGFTDVSGLSIETQVETKTFGGENDRSYSFFTNIKYSDITLKHGFSDQNFLWEWYSCLVNGVYARKNGSIYLLDDSRRAVIWWDFYGAFPVKWEGPTFSASGSAVAFESITLTHQGLFRSK